MCFSQVQIYTGLQACKGGKKYNMQQKVTVIVL